MKQVYLIHYGFWTDILDERPEYYVAKDLDGVTCFVIKDGTEITRAPNGVKE